MTLPNLDLGLKGGRVMVTGAAGGIGRAVAVRFAALGCRMALCDIDAVSLAGVVASPPQESGGHVAIPFDLADGAACRGAVSDAAAALGRLARRPRV